jgi:hypothetical protein
MAREGDREAVHLECHMRHRFDQVRVGRAVSVPLPLDAAGTISTVRVAILGPLEVHEDGGASVAVAGARLRGLIARLALAGGQPVSTGALAEAGIWLAELASVTDAADVPQAVLGAIGLRESRR